MNPAIARDGGLELETMVENAVKTHSDFRTDYIGEHDSGTVMVNNRLIHWYIWYHSTYEFEEPSADPADPRQTIRVLYIGFPPSAD